ncbi:MAG: carbohydrate ABC transporter substrate-binding protein, partial [Clostridia bacterium]|nr:carbohydrate ABC transporter substrate-binding protein [Clostridia bacterium]
MQDGYLLGMEKEEGELRLFSDLGVCTLGDDYMPATDWEETEASALDCLGEYQLDHRMNTLIKMEDGIGRSVDPYMIMDLDPKLGYWKLDGADYLVVNRLAYDDTGETVEYRESVIFPLGVADRESGIGDEILLKGVTLDDLPVVSDGRWNYYVVASVLCRTDGKTVQELGNLTHYGVNLSGIRQLVAVEDGILVLTLKGLFFFGESVDVLPIKTGEGYGTVVVGCLLGAPPIFEEQVSLYNMQTAGNVEIRVFEERAQLNLAILSGDVDMVVGHDSGFIRNYAKRGVLEPLKNVIGETLSSGELMENVVEAGRVNGEIYMIPDLVRICGMQIPKSLADEVDGRFDSMRELIDMLNREGGLCFQKYDIKEIVFGNMIDLTISNWIDEENATCSFDDPDFAAVLEYCNGAHDNIDEAFLWREQNEDYTIFWPCQYAWWIENLELTQRFLDPETGRARTEHGVAAALIPVPNQKGYELAMNSEQFMAIVRQSRVKASAGEFLTWLLSEETQRDAMERNFWGLPTNRKVLEEEIERATREAVASGRDETEIRESYKEGLRLYESANYYAGLGHQAVRDLIMEEA